jgi:D-alanyl-D-alanine carboxypeptidase/D-alanyl-D-alanine-endopeptidase (penicillin-binding protein 4)
VESLAGGERLFEVNAGTLLVPASTLKIVTAATAAVAVGWDYVFETRAALNGTIGDGVVHGDLIITGTGDPSIQGRGGTDFVSALIAALREKQITRIDGRVIGDDNLIEEPRPGLAWAWDDLGTTTGAIAGALNLGENTLAIMVAPGSEPGAPTSVTLPPEALDFPIINRSTTAARQTAQTLWAEQRPGEKGLTIAGTIATGAAPARLVVAVGNPTLWFARIVRAHLNAAAIEVQGPSEDIDDLPTPPSPGVMILTHRSRPLGEIVKPMLKYSINMYADSLLRLATGPSGTRTTADAISAERRQLRLWGVRDDSTQIADGSGLSRLNLVTPEALVMVLGRMYDPTGASPFMQALPIGGVDGTLENRMKSTAAAGNVRAKTGAMTHVRTLVGYVTTKDGEPLAFAVMANNFEGVPTTVTSTMDRMVVRLASFSRHPIGALMPPAKPGDDQASAVLRVTPRTTTRTVGDGR